MIVGFHCVQPNLQNLCFSIIPHDNQKSQNMKSTIASTNNNEKVKQNYWLNYFPLIYRFKKLKDLILEKLDKIDLELQKYTALFATTRYMNCIIHKSLRSLRYN